MMFGAQGLLGRAPNDPIINIPIIEMIRESIQQALKDNGIPQRRCAIDCGIAPQTLNNFLRGHRPLPLEQLEKVLTYLKIEMK